MHDQGEVVTVRLLPTGEPQPARLESQAGPRLRIRLTDDTAVPGLGASALVEVQSEQFLYLGEVLGRQQQLLIVAVEHAVNRAALAAIQDVWHTPREA